MILDVLAEPRRALGPLWNGYVVLVHATAFLAGVGLVSLCLRRAPARARGTGGGWRRAPSPSRGRGRR
jgi:hypothetical protein